ncbi:ankyrin repeat-containing protein At5g02620-like [Fagus crenata]
MTEEILESLATQGQRALINKADQEGSTPLHCAAYFDSFKTIRLLLTFDRNAAYMKDVKGRTALHIAAHRGHDEIMNSILLICPDCSELVDNRGWNALHFAVNSSRWPEDAVQVILDRSMLSNLLNEKDANGNTPLHFHSKSSQYLEALICHDRVDKMAFNNQNLDAHDIALTNAELSDEKYWRSEQFRQFFKDDLIKKMRIVNNSKDWLATRKPLRDRFVSMMEKAYQIHLVADTLIATVTFAAGITMPGGFIDKDGTHPGSAVLMKNTAFRAFVITDTIAMMQSCAAAFILLFMPLLFDVKNPTYFSFPLAILAFCFTISAMGAMVLAFVTGTYAVLMHSFDLAIATCIISLCFFIPGLFISIRSLKHLRKMWGTVISWEILKNHEG